MKGKVSPKLSDYTKRIGKTDQGMLKRYFKNKKYFSKEQKLLKLGSSLKKKVKQLFSLELKKKFQKAGEIMKKGIKCSNTK